MSFTKPSEKIVLALDGMDANDVFSLLPKLPELIWIKVGLELFTLCGPEILVELKKHGKRIFLDLKFHDIPTTMAHACFHAARSKAELITVHACAGHDALVKANEAAKEGAQSVGLPSPTLLAVTVLTSWSPSNFQSEIGFDQSIDERVKYLAALAFNAGIGGCVCSPLEVRDLRISFPEPFELVTPGIRFSDSSLDDQSRVLSPLEALRAGASKLVLGRIITRAENPQETFKRVCDEIEGT